MKREYSIEKKKSIVEYVLECIKNKESKELISVRVDIPISTLNNWIDDYKAGKLNKKEKLEDKRDFSDTSNFFGQGRNMRRRRDGANKYAGSNRKSKRWIQEQKEKNKDINKSKDKE